MEYYVIFLVLIGSSGLISPQVFGDNKFCNIDENMKIQEELIKDDVFVHYDWPNKSDNVANNFDFFQ